MGIKKGNVKTGRIHIEDRRTEAEIQKRQEEIKEAERRDKRMTVIILVIIVVCMILSFILPSIL